MTWMRTAVAIVLVACGARPPPQETSQQHESDVLPIRVEWKAVQAPDEQVAVTLVVEGKPFDLGTLPAATENEVGTPHTCALRASGTRTDFVCGDLASFYSAALAGEEIIVSLVERSTAREVRRIPVYGTSFAVQPYKLPE